MRTRVQIQLTLALGWHREVDPGDSLVGWGVKRKWDLCGHTLLDEEWIGIERYYGTKGILVCCSWGHGTLVLLHLLCNAASSSPTLTLSLGKERAAPLRGPLPLWVGRR